jgi:hypothetical protein
MKPVILLQHTLLYSTLARYRCKKDVPKGTQGTPVVASFGLWGVWYIIRGFGGLRCQDGGDMRFHELRLNDGTVIYGQRDSMAAEGRSFDDVWRESLAESNLAKIGVVGGEVLS